MIFNIAILEDNDDHFKFLEHALQIQGFEYKIERFKEVSEAVSKLYGRAPDVILLDLNLVDSTGFDTFETLKKVKSPVIVLSVLEDIDLALKIMKEGAFYVVKDWVFSYPLLLHLLLRRAYDLSQGRERLKVLIQERLGKFQKLIPRCSFCIPRIGEARYKNEATDFWFTLNEYFEQFDIRFTDGICPECFEDIRKAMFNGSADTEGS